jgi:(1->4)-alpha-D-glucan 1-alpha-D-glucosylmutase
VREVVAADRARPVPLATYRLQLNHTFTFADARAIVPYLASLGISHVYASPIFKAAKGSLHGYDVVDYGQINPEIGTPEEFAAFVDELHDHDLRLILDFVPNHMGIDGGANAWWQDVIEHGEMSRFAEYFDIDWTPLKRELRNKVLVPFLGGQYGEVLERGELKLAFEQGGFLVRSWETPFPLDPRTYPIVLRRAQGEIDAGLEEDDLDRLEFESIVTALERLPGPQDLESTDDAIEVRHREQLVARHRLATLAERSETVRGAIEGAVTTLNGTVGDPRSFDALDALLNVQPFRLSYWRVAAEEINYRRFFAINTLAAIRQEEPEVFAATHRLLIELLVSGAADGVRIDHPDGLWDPAGYFRALQSAYVAGAVRARLNADDEAWESLEPEVEAAIETELEQIAATDRRWPLYVIGEKILEHGEDLPADWALAGTVGYEFAQAATGLFVDPEARIAFDRVTSRFTGDSIRFPELVHAMKMQMMREAFPSEVNVLTNVLNRISERDRHSRDFTVNNLRWALREVIACFSVYRTYTTCDEAGVAERDERYIREAIKQARRRNQAVDASVFDFIEAVLLLHGTDNPRERLDQRCHFAMKLQQLSSPVMAKGLEDTAFYRFNRLVSLNEVGSDPSRFGIPPEEFHRHNRARGKAWPAAMLSSSTHDTKRSEDVRARISVLSEIPNEWRAATNRWSRLNRKLKVKLEGALAPHRVDEYVLYQTLVGTWPLDGFKTTSRQTYTLRLQEYIVKVAREASRHTNWVNPNDAYESALKDFVTGMLHARRSRAFQADLTAFIDGVATGGLVNGLAQQVLKLTAPGMPDVYQGTETWDDSLVDPDNRRPVPFDRHRELLPVALERDLPELVANLRDGAVKLAITARLLGLRHDCPELFSEGDYHALAFSGPAAAHAVGFVRRTPEATLLVIVPRLLTKRARALHTTVLDPVLWEGTTAPLPKPAGDRWHDVLRDAPVEIAADGLIELSSLFRDAPLAVLRSTTA